MPSFQLATRLNSQNGKEIGLFIISDTLICIRILVFPIRIIELSSPRNWIFLIYFISLHIYWPPSTLNVFVYNSLGEMEWCEKHAFQLLKIRKMKVSWNIKTKCVTEFNWQLGLRVWRIILVITESAHKIKVYIIFKK